jgi:predicted lipid carrier protein YhbT
MNPQIEQLLIEKTSANPQGAFLICFKSPEGIQSFLDTRNVPATVSHSSTEAARMTMILKPEDLLEMLHGTLDPTKAFMSGRLEIEGDMSIAMKLAAAFKSK